jgi:hypothetical protein
MKKQDKELLRVSQELVRIIPLAQGPDNLRERYNHHNEDSVGRLLAWYYRQAGQVIAKRHGSKQWFANE